MSFSAYEAQRELITQLEEVREHRGELTPQAVLAEVEETGKRHPLYDRFEWNNRVAGHGYRLDQAHRLIMSVKVIFRGPTDEERKIRKYVAVPQPMAHQPNYEPIEDVAMDDLKRKLVLQDAERRWKALRTQFGHLQEFIDLVLGDLNGKAS
jgi:hypothetical protein